MSRGTFYINNTNQEFNVLVEQINGNGGNDSPKIVVPIKINFNPGGQTQGNESFDVLSIKGELSLAGGNFKLSEAMHLQAWTIRNANSYNVNFQFMITPEILSKLEKYRQGGIQFNLSVTMQIAIHERVKLINQNTERIFISGFDTSSGQCTFQVEQSFWVNNILPQLGHNSFKLVELPATNQLIPDEYKISINEFEEARKYFLNGDYDKTVSHCRVALEPFKKTLPQLKEFVKSKSEFDWANTVMDATEVWLEKIIKATSNFTSKTHHAPSVGHFSRTEAEIVLMITTGIIAYIGKIEYKQQN